MLEAYERLCPGSAQRIMKWVDDERDHMREMERTTVSLVAAERRRGQMCAVAVCLAAFAAAGWCAYVGAGAAASIIGGSTVVGLVVAFLGVRKIES